MTNFDQWEIRVDALGLKRATIDVYLWRFCKLATNTKLDPYNKLLNNPAENLRYDKYELWIVKEAQRGRKIYGCKRTSSYFCEKYKLGLHPDYYKSYH